MQDIECYISSDSTITQTNLPYDIRIVCTDSNLLPNKQVAELNKMSTFDNLNVKESDYIYMACIAEETDCDWYGEFIYLTTPLQKYTYKSNLWEYKIMKGDSKGWGIAGVAVKTTLDVLSLLGWRSDYDFYSCSKECYDKF